MTAEELKAMSDGDLRELAEEIRRELRRRYERDAWKKYVSSESPSARKALRNWIDRTLADVEKAEEIAMYENSLYIKDFKKRKEHNYESEIL